MTSKEIESSAFCHRVSISFQISATPRIWIRIRIRTPAVIHTQLNDVDPLNWYYYSPQVTLHKMELGQGRAWHANWAVIRLGWRTRTWAGPHPVGSFWFLVLSFVSRKLSNFWARIRGSGSAKLGKAMVFGRDVIFLEKVRQR